MPPLGKNRVCPLRSGTHDELTGLGIREEKHTFTGLASFFPVEFHIQQANFDIETLAEVLLHLAKQGILKIPRKTQQ